MSRPALVLIAEQTTVSPKNPYSREKLCPVLGLYVAEDWKAACHRVVELLTNEGLGHTLVIHTRNQDVIRQFSLEKPVNRILINTRRRSAVSARLPTSLQR